MKIIQMKQDNWLKIHNKNGNEILRNPINNIVYNEAEQKRIDEQENNRRQRYKLKDEIEDYYRNLDYNKEINDLKNKDNKISYYKFKTTDERGYDIINLKNTYSQYKDNGFR